METSIPKKQNRTRQLLLTILLVVIVLAIGYFIYVYLINRPGTTPEELAERVFNLMDTQTNSSLPVDGAAKAARLINDVLNSSL